MEDKILKCSNCGSNDVIAKQKGFDGANAAKTIGEEAAGNIS